MPKEALIEFQAARQALVQSLRREISDQRVLDAFARVPRERFVAPELERYAYDDRALPIGHGQTISQPMMVALMLHALALTGDEKVLEVGTGSGYQAALLAILVREVVTVERIPELAAGAERRLRDLGCDNAHVHIARDDLGWPEGGPFNAIIVAAGAPDVPSSLVDQLAMGGRMVVPVGARRLQQLVRVTRSERGVTLEKLGECRFVPLIAPAEGWPAREATPNGSRPWA